MPTKKKRIDSDLTNCDRTRNTQAMRMELTNNEYETEARRTMQFLKELT